MADRKPYVELRVIIFGGSVLILIFTDDETDASSNPGEEVRKTLWDFPTIGSQGRNDVAADGNDFEIMLPKDCDFDHFVDGPDGSLFSRVFKFVGEYGLFITTSSSKHGKTWTPDRLVLGYSYAVNESSISGDDLSKSLAFVRGELLDWVEAFEKGITVPLATHLEYKMEARMGAAVIESKKIAAKLKAMRKQV